MSSMMLAPMRSAAWTPGEGAFSASLEVPGFWLLVDMTGLGLRGVTGFSRVQAA